MKLFTDEIKYSPTKFPSKWHLRDGYPIPTKGKVFSCFSCGGGSTMGYKLAGFEVIGCNEIDPKMMAVYRENHHPKYSFLEPIQEFKNRQDLPQDLFELDILDGSPPCSSFSMAGNREKDWGKEKKFREGQANQVLDTLFFDFIVLAKRLKPKVIIAENVKGLMLGNARHYLKRIFHAFREAGYSVTATLLDASIMGVPQRRERVFFTALRLDLAEKMNWKNIFVPEIDLQFNERPIIFGEISGGERRVINNGKGSIIHTLWQKRRQGDNTFCEISKRENGFERYMTVGLIKNNSVFPTLVSNTHYYTFDECEIINKQELLNISTFPQDYIFNIEPKYIMGMSVPPVMAAQVATRVHEQWLSPLR